MDKIYARFVAPDAGYDSDQQKVRAASLELDKRYVLDDASVGSWFTDVWLEGVSGTFNSVHFEFEDEAGNPVDIYHMPRYSAYAMP